MDFGRHGLRNILVPTDFSESSDTALHIAIDLATQQKARIYLLHVTPDRQITDQMNKIEDQIARFPEAKSVNVVPEVRAGTAYDEIIKMQLEKEIDLIAMPGHFKTGSLFDRFRNITARIKRKAPCSVLVVGI
jgi:nucleotide-binding universal stress UspA family protein